MNVPKGDAVAPAPKGPVEAGRAAVLLVLVLVADVAAAFAVGPKRLLPVPNANLGGSTAGVDAALVVEG